MKALPNILRLKGFRDPREIIAYTVWADYRVALSSADDEKFLVERAQLSAEK